MKKSNIKGSRKMKELMEKIMNDLYYLEDLNNYKINNIGRLVNLAQTINIKVEE